MIEAQQNQYKRICVLLATYNGEKYLEQQIDSILAQEGVEVDILVRDDGSNDGTISILERYKHENKLNYYIGQENLGACNSFIDLMWHVSLDYDYYSLSDQDDFWLSDKLKRAVDTLDTIEDDIKVYSSFYTTVDEALHPIPDARHDSVAHSFGNSLLENQLTGCTAVMSKVFLEKVRSYERPKEQYVHDWWLYKMSELFGTLVIDRESRILYRQHSGNTIGLSNGFISRVDRIVKNSKKMETAIRKQNKEFVSLYPLDENKKRLFDIVDRRTGVLELLFNKELRRITTLETIICKFWIMTWRRG